MKRRICVLAALFVMGGHVALAQERKEPVGRKDAPFGSKASAAATHRATTESQAFTDDVEIDGGPNTNAPYLLFNPSITGWSLSWIQAGINPATGGYGDSMYFRVPTGKYFYFNSAVSVGGNVGIGTTSPVNKLHIFSAGNGISDGIRISASDALTNGGYLILNKNSGVGTIATLQSGDSYGWGSLVLNPNGGNVGIGTNTPGQKLEVGGDVLMNASGDVGLRFLLANGGGGRIYRNGTTGDLYLVPQTNTIINPGNLGVGTTNPTQKLEVAGDVLLNTTGDVGLRFVLTNGAGGRIYRNGTTGDLYITPQTNTILSSGNVGIGAAAPVSKLQVQGDLRVGSNGANTDVRIFTDAPATLNNIAYNQVNAVSPVTVPAAGTVTHTALYLKNATAANQGTNQIDLVVDGNIAAKYQDVAEWVPASGNLAAGTVVTIDPAGVNRVLPTARAYDTAVAGVISRQPGITLGEAGGDKALVATTGRVRVRVTAEGRPIHAGDLLVASNEPGTAMASVPVEVNGLSIHRPGTVIGKALEPLKDGRGDILVLLTLQ